jgi:addiction module RelB/DinJ family antitoxin/addiction module RelE/StbE family toxin
LRIDADKLTEAKQILSQLGMNFSENVNILTNLIVAKQGLPFDFALPNEETKSTMFDVHARKNLETITLEQLQRETGTQWKPFCATKRSSKICAISAWRTDIQATKFFLYVVCLLNDEPLPPEAKDYALQGEWSDFRELHPGGDSLLIYQTDAQHVYLTRLGSHVQLFKGMWATLQLRF